jgi:hypothetical protein
VTVTCPVVGPAEAPFDTVTVSVAPCCPCVKFPVCASVMLKLGATGVVEAEPPTPTGVVGAASPPPPHPVTQPSTIRISENRTKGLSEPTFGGEFISFFLGLEGHVDLPASIGGPWIDPRFDLDGLALKVVKFEASGASDKDSSNAEN